MSKKRILIVICAFSLIIIIFLLIMIKSKNYKDFYVSKNKWDSIINSKSENKDLKIDSIYFNEYQLIIDESKSIIYYSIVKGNNNSYNPNIKYNLNSKSKLVILDDGITDKNIENHEFSIMVYNDDSYHIYSLVCLEFPILNINYNMDGKQKKGSVPVNIYLFDNRENSNNRIIKSDGKLNEKNQNNYILHLELLSPGNNVRDNVISLMGMEPSSKYTLTKVSKSEENMTNQNTGLLELFKENKYIGLYRIDILK